MEHRCNDTEREKTKQCSGTFLFAWNLTSDYVTSLLKHGKGPLDHGKGPVLNFMFFISCTILTMDHVHRQMHIIGLQSIHKFYITATCFGDEAPSKGVSNTKERKH
jgi:hypothetical protein